MYPGNVHVVGITTCSSDCKNVHFKSRMVTNYVIKMSLYVHSVWLYHILMYLQIKNLTSKYPISVHILVTALRCCEFVSIVISRSTLGISITVCYVCCYTDD
jgi:hypothetical protein